MEGDEVRVRDVEQGAELLLEAVDRDRVGLPHRLDRDGHPGLQVAGAVDDPHPAAAEDADDLVAVERRPARLGPCRVADGRTGPPLGSSRARWVGLDRPVDLEEVAERLGQVGESRRYSARAGDSPRCSRRRTSL